MHVLPSGHVLLASRRKRQNRKNAGGGGNQRFCELTKCRGGPPARPAGAARAHWSAVCFRIAWLAFGVAGGPEGRPYTAAGCGSFTSASRCSNVCGTVSEYISRPTPSPDSSADFRKCPAIAIAS